MQVIVSRVIFTCRPFSLSSETLVPPDSSLETVHVPTSFEASPLAVSSARAWITSTSANADASNTILRILNPPLERCLVPPRLHGGKRRASRASSPKPGRRAASQAGGRAEMGSCAPSVRSGLRCFMAWLAPTEVRSGWHHVCLGAWNTALFFTLEWMMVQQATIANAARKGEATNGAERITREQLIAALNEDLAREYQAVIAYVVYSQVLKGAQYMSIAKELEAHAKEELDHAFTIAKQIDYLGGLPTVNPKPVKTWERDDDILRFD